jgi:hypothetical protein
MFAAIFCRRAVGFSSMQRFGRKNTPKSAEISFSAIAEVNPSLRVV